MDNLYTPKEVMSLQQQIDSLPKWPDSWQYGLIVGRDCDENGWPLTQPGAVRRMELAELTSRAALSRLALAREWISAAGHLHWCESSSWVVKDDAPCDCGFNPLLAVLDLSKRQ